MPNAATQSKQLSDPVDHVRNMSKWLTAVIEGLRGRYRASRGAAIQGDVRDCCGRFLAASLPPSGTMRKKANALGNSNDPKAEIGRLSPIFT
jgi:hypothetical protein